MRHGKKLNHLSRKTAHRKALLANLSIALIEHKRIKTTLAKAKALRVYVEPLITKSKSDTTHSRRVVFSYLNNKHAITELFGAVANKIGERPGGYTRILRTRTRPGDNAQMCIIELVDFNETYQLDKKEVKKKRSRRGSVKSKTREATPKIEKAKTTEVAEPSEPIVEDIEEVKEDVAEEVKEKNDEEVEVKPDTDPDITEKTAPPEDNANTNEKPEDKTEKE